MGLLFPHAYVNIVIRNKAVAKIAHPIQIYRRCDVALYAFIIRLRLFHSNLVILRKWIVVLQTQTDNPTGRCCPVLRKKYLWINKLCPWVNKKGHLICTCLDLLEGHAYHWTRKTFKLENLTSKSSAWREDQHHGHSQGTKYAFIILARSCNFTDV